MPYLVVGENERIGDDNVFGSRGVEYDNLGNVVGGEGVTAAMMSGDA